MRKQFSAGGVLLNNRNEIYLLHQTVRDEWILPKGGIEKGEDEITAATRETKEETGYHNFETISEKPIHVQHFSFIHPDTGEDIEKTVTFFLFKLLDNNLEKTKEMEEEHLEGEWFPLEEAIKKISFDDLKVVLDKTKEKIFK